MQKLKEFIQILWKEQNKASHCTFITFSNFLGLFKSFFFNFKLYFYIVGKKKCMKKSGMMNIICIVLYVRICFRLTRPSTLIGTIHKAYVFFIALNAIIIVSALKYAEKISTNWNRLYFQLFFFLSLYRFTLYQKNKGVKLNIYRLYFLLLIAFFSLQFNPSSRIASQSLFLLKQSIFGD